MTDDTPRAGGRRAVDDVTRARIVKLARAGTMSRNAIARACGVGRQTVSRICDAEGVTFDRSQTVAATQAAATDARAERARIANDTLAKVRDLMAKLDSSHEVLHWDKDGILHRETIDSPVAADVQRYTTSIGILLDKHIALERHDGSNLELSGVDKYLAHLLGSQSA